MNDSIHRKPYRFYKKLLKLISEFGKTVQFGVNIQKSIIVLSTNNELSEKKIRKKYIYYSNKKNKVPKNKFNQKGKRLCCENYTTLKKEFEEDTNKWKHMTYSWIRRIRIIRMSMLPKATNRFNTIPIKIPMTYFTDMKQTFQKTYRTMNDPK